eukprot:1458858-Prymnesium_polylepis.1
MLRPRSGRWRFLGALFALHERVTAGGEFWPEQENWYDVWPRRLLRRHFSGSRGRSSLSARRVLATSRVSDEVPLWVRLLWRPVGLCR